jgi:hypothetical protein
MGPSLVSFISIAVSVLSFLATAQKLLELFITRRNRTSKLHEAQEQEFEKILESDDLIKIGSYFDERVGEFNVQEYVASSDVSEIVDRYLEKLKTFVGTDAEVNEQIQKIGAPREIEKLSHIPDEFDKVAASLREGEIWNGLARLRRHIEITLRRVIDDRNIQMRPYPSAGQILNVLKMDEAISPDAYSELKYSVTICNKAIHGLDVELEEAEEALFHAIEGLRKLRESHHVSREEP